MLTILAISFGGLIGWYIRAYITKALGYTIRFLFILLVWTIYILALTL